MWCLLSLYTEYTELMTSVAVTGKFTYLSLLIPFSTICTAVVACILLFMGTPAFLKLLRTILTAATMSCYPGQGLDHTSWENAPISINPYSLSPFDLILHLQSYSILLSIPLGPAASGSYSLHTLLTPTSKYWLGSAAHLKHSIGYFLP